MAKKAKKADVPDKKELLSSARSTLTDDDDDGTDSDKDDGKPLSIDDAIDANINAYVAEHGDPFAEE